MTKEPDRKEIDKLTERVDRLEGVLKRLDELFPPDGGGPVFDSLKGIRDDLASEREKQDAVRRDLDDLKDHVKLILDQPE